MSEGTPAPENPVPTPTPQAETSSRDSGETPNQSATLPTPATAADLPTINQESNALKRKLLERLIQGIMDL